MKIAFTDKHFGKTEEFIIVRVSPTGWNIIETRKIPPGCRDCGAHDQAATAAVLDELSDCGAVLAARIGPPVQAELERRGIQALEVSGERDRILRRYAAYLALGRRPARKPVSEPEHPCFAGGRQSNAGRVHLPVSDKCNIACRFCTRSRNNTENRPGVARGLLTPEAAPALVRRALELCPEITVAGVAGPGDALASPRALEALRLVHEAFPELIKCVSTNGLALPGKGKALFDAGVRAVTVTVNAVDPGILREIVDCPDHALLIKNQLAGIRELAQLGIRVKINTVLVPEANGGHVADIARAARAAGAQWQNIIPLIPNHKMAGRPAPSCQEIEFARAAAGQYLNQFRHCAHCRADAAGIPGGADFSEKLYAGGERIAETFSHG
ncbi:MAG: radical SAM protein [Clostridiales bacterium]|jgi:nitrogen fixation protein NifB|nr:radical SAM protein [Clostridiales bacterium]